MGSGQTENRLSHAYILTGPDKEAQKAEILRRIEELQGPDPVHPDVVWLRREKATVITVGEVRQRIVDDILIRPFREPYKIYVIEDAELLGAAAQNALLKTLEEPPEYGILFLMTDRLEALLDTVLSRAVVLTIAAEGEMSLQQTQELLQIIRGLPNNRTVDNDRAAVRLTELAKEGVTAGRFLDLMRRWFRDVLFVRENVTNQLYFPSEKEYYIKDTDQLTRTDIFQIFDWIGEAEGRLRAGANMELVLKGLFARIRDRKDY